METMTLPEKLSDLIEKWDIVSLNSEIKKQEHEEWIRNNAWDLIPVLIEPANSENLEKCPQVVHACSQILSDHVARLGNPKEIIISLLEQCEHSASSIKFRHCLPALEISLLKLDLRTASLTWDWALRTISDHVTGLDLPEMVELEGEERLIFEHDEEYVDLLKSCEDATNLLKSLHLRMKDFEDGPMKEKIKGVLIWSCIQLLGKPLSFMHVCVTSKGVPSTAKIVSDDLRNLLDKLCKNQVKLIALSEFCSDYQTPKMLDSDARIWSFGIGHYFQSLFLEKDPSLPLCYSPLFVFGCLLDPIVQMLHFNRGSTSHYFRQEKGLDLCLELLKRLPRNNLPPDSIDMPGQSELLGILYQIIIFHGIESVRKKAFHVYNVQFDIFGQGHRALVKLVKHALEKANHSGLMGHAIGKLKNGILKEMSKVPEASLPSLVKRFCRLKNGAETDLLEVSDEVMASLNFLICLLIRDKNNCLKLWDIVPELEKDFLKPLSTGLSMSRAHYKLKLNEQSDLAQPGDAEVSLMVGGQALPQMSREQMKEVVHSALNTFDMMECVLCQLNDVISAKK